MKLTEEKKGKRRPGVHAAGMKSCRLPPKQYNDLDRIAGEENTSVQMQLEKAVDFYIRNYNNRRLHDTSVMGDIQARMKRMEDRLAALLAKSGVDTSTAVELLLVALGNKRSEPEIEDMYWEARRRGVAKFTKKLHKEDFEVTSLIAASSNEEDD